VAAIDLGRYWSGVSGETFARVDLELYAESKAVDKVHVEGYVPLNIPTFAEKEAAEKLLPRSAAPLKLFDVCDSTEFLRG
jgi:hypothetical protein